MTPVPFVPLLTSDSINLRLLYASSRSNLASAKRSLTTNNALLWSSTSSYKCDNSLGSNCFISPNIFVIWSIRLFIFSFMESILIFIQNCIDYSHRCSNYLYINYIHSFHKIIRFFFCLTSHKVKCFYLHSILATPLFSVFATLDLLMCNQRSYDKFLYLLTGHITTLN